MSIKPSLVFTIFGSTGDLTYRKLLPALYHLKHRSHLAEDLEIRCIGRRNYSQTEYLEIIEPWIRKQTRFQFDDATYLAFTKHIRYMQMEFTDLNAYILLDDVPRGVDNLYYFAVSPEFFKTIAAGLHQSGNLKHGTHRVILEKPFGDSLEHAKQVHQALLQWFKKEHIYHIDHYLGKEMIQNILAIRFSNRLFEAVWNSEHIEQIQITAAETVGVETRGAYYEQAGAIKDMLQNHLLQIMSYVVMERPATLNSLDMVNKQISVLSNVSLDKLVIGQYDAKDEHQAYRNEQNVDPNSKIDTYAAVRLHLEDGPLKGVPIYLRTGKRLNQRATYIKVIFKAIGNDLYQCQQREVLTIKVQPDEGISLAFNAKKPGTINTITEVKMDFCQSCILENRINTPEAYERLLDDAFNHDDGLFTPWPIVELSWHFGEAVTQKIKRENIALALYPSYTRGPDAADQMLNEDTFFWLDEDALSD